ncbi:hypothetical protein AB0N09_19070 [Streptomyces erythrochromogenes]|uniref:hypothetical protein n=1 Tax=Streptomyces erythrochromogenes TaxID=285574 RepID=UPI003433484A
MDEYEEFRNLARTLVGHLQAGGNEKKTVSHGGLTIEGWVVDPGHSYGSETHYSPGAWKEVWGNNDEIILGTDSELYSHSWGCTESADTVGTERRASLTKLAAKDLVGQDGAPFHTYTEKLKRLRWS